MSRERKYSLVAASILAFVVLIAGGFAAGFSLGRRVPVTIEVRGIDNIGSATTTPDFGTFWEAWQTINDEFLNAQTVSGETKVRGAIRGLVGSLGDPYSEYFTPEEAESFKQDVEGSFSGIGAEIGIRKDQLVVVAPLKDSPAEKAGLKSGDKILLINSTSTEDMAVDQAVRYIRGPEGSTVKLTILREGWDKPKEIPIVRRAIEAPTLDFKMIEPNIAYLALYSFNANAERLFWSAMRQAALQNAEAVILDLRGNPGGYLDVAADLSGWFLKRGTVVVKEVGRNDEVMDTIRAEGNEALVKIPVVVLVDKGSASAAEILAGALHDVRKIKLVGETTFGKGTVQQFMDLRDNSVIKLTIAHWVLPSGRVLDHDGLAPDYEVKITEEDIAAKRDPQLDKAVEVMKKEIK